MKENCVSILPHRRSRGDLHHPGHTVPSKAVRTFLGCAAGQDAKLCIVNREFKPLS